MSLWWNKFNLIWILKSDISDWKKNSDQTYSCPRDLYLSASWGANRRPPWNYRIEGFMGPLIGPPLCWETSLRQHMWVILIWVMRKSWGRRQLAPSMNDRKSPQDLSPSIWARMLLLAHCFSFDHEPNGILFSPCCHYDHIILNLK